MPALACSPLPGTEGLSAQVDPGTDTIPGGDSVAVASAPVPAAAVLDSILHTLPLGRAHWGVAVWDAATGTPVLEHNPERLFTAASTMKLVTAAAALDLLGPDYRFETVVEAAVDSTGVARWVRVRGGGDPSQSRAFHQHPLAPLDSLADSLAARVRRVDGPLIVDQSRFDSVRVHPAWEAFDLDWYYAAPVAPTAVMRGALEVIVTPGAVGEPAAVALPFADGLVTVDARIRTVAGGDRWDDVLRRDGDRLVLRGAIGAGAGPDTSWIAQTDPGQVAGRALKRALERAGVAVTGGVETRNRGGEEEPATHRVVWRSPPLDSIIQVALARSDNWVTEQVLKSLAAERWGRGDWSGGTELVERYMVDRVGVAAGSVYMRDGSGLTSQGLLTPAAVTTLLRYAATRPWGSTFRDGLAHPGQPEGTLDDRLLPYADRVAAKTGTLRHVNALSGYLRTRDGGELVFSILSNGSGRPSWEVQPAVDRLVESLLENED